jgi:hypothetical protein
MAEYELNYRPIPDEPLYIAATKVQSALMNQEGGAWVHVMKKSLERRTATPPASYEDILLGQISGDLESIQSAVWEEDDPDDLNYIPPQYPNPRVAHSFRSGMVLALGTLDMLHGDIADVHSVLESMKEGVKTRPVDLSDPEFIRDTALLDHGHDGLIRIGDGAWNQVELWANDVISPAMPQYENYRRICMLGSGAVFETAYRLHEMHNEYAALLDLTSPDDTPGENAATTGE